MATHLIVGANAQLDLSEKEWQRLLDRTTGHVKIKAGARVKVRPTPPRKRNEKS